MPRWIAIVVLPGLLAACSSLLPKSKETTSSSWQSFQDVQDAFDKVIPGKTSIAELRPLSLDPSTNPNIVILNHSDVMRKFMLNKSFSLDDLDQGVRECVTAKLLCRGFEINQTSVQKRRNGNAVLDLLRLYRETHTAGWRFNGLILIKEDIVVYKLTSGQPVIHRIEENQDLLGPLQKVTSRFNGNTTEPALDRINLEDPYDVRDWARKFGVSEDELRAAASTVGPMAKDVQRQLGR